jgi:NADPH:quinone reductase-like Zn-dependent oxidoreductase
VALRAGFTSTRGQLDSIFDRRSTMNFLAIPVASVFAAALVASFSPQAGDAPKDKPVATATMKAVRIHEFGGPEVLKYEDAPKPSAGKGEILVRVSAAGVNPVDWKIRHGRGKDTKPDAPMILGYDVAGVVESVGEGAKMFKPGDEVFAYLSLMHGGGYAEYVAIPEQNAAKKPEKIDAVHAAAVPVAGLTAYQALFDTAALKPGQTVLIHGAAGGVGHFAVQLAKSVGAKVIATGSATSADFLKELGADQVIDYKTQKFEEIVKDVDVVLDTIGGDTLARSYGVVKSGGIIVSIVEKPAADKAKEKGIRAVNILVKPNGSQLSEIAKLIDAGKVKPHVSHTFALEEAAKAHELSEAGHTRGKIVLKVR